MAASTSTSAPHEVVVAIDGANVCGGDRYATKKLEAAVDYFRQLKPSPETNMIVKCVAFVPNFWLNEKPKEDGGERMETEGWELLGKLVKDKKVTLTPSQAHDDFYVIAYAIKYNGFIVSNDMYRDHVANKRIFHGKVLRMSWLKKHAIDFTFVEDEFMPNPVAINRLLTHTPHLDSPPSARGSVLSSISNESTPTAPLAKPATTLEAENEPDTSLQVKANRTIDLEEVTNYRVPWELVPFIHGENGETLKNFKEHTNTHILIPHPNGQRDISGRQHAATLSIYGAEENRAQAVQALDMLLHDHLNGNLVLSSESYAANAQEEMEID